VLSLHAYIFSLRHAIPGKNIHSGITFGRALLRGVVQDRVSARKKELSAGKELLRACAPPLNNEG
jgi:hypothetical protein